MRSSRGFTLTELMVIVVLVGLLATLAVPSLTGARNERLIFDYARKIASIIHRAQARAMGRGSPHLVTIEPGGAGGRGLVMLFEGTDNTSPAGPAPDPDTTNGCRTHNWAFAWSGFAPGAIDPGRFTEPLEGINLNGTAGSINVANVDIMTTFAVNGAAAGAIAICYSRSGTPYVGYGGSTSAAVTDPATGIVVAGPFADVVEITVLRRIAAVPVGTGRKVLVASSSAPRIRPCDGATPGCP